MWPNKDYLYFKAVYTKEGAADFSLNIHDKVPIIYGVIFALDIYSRMHSHCNKESLKYYNSILDTLIEDSQTLGNQMSIKKLDKYHEDAFILRSHIMHNPQETFIYKWSGINLRYSSINANIPFKGSEINMAFAFSRLLLLLSEALSSEKIELLMNCFAKLSTTEKFILREYNFIKYNSIPKKIFYEFYPEASSFWA